MLNRIFFFSTCVLGIAYCISNALGIETFCETSGCSITKDFKLFGLSLYWFGALGFFLFGVLRASHALKTLRFYALGVIALDCALLLVLAFSAPCMSCMIVGGLFFLLGLLIFLESDKALQSRAFQAVLVTWAICLAPNVINATGELVGPQPIYGEKTADVKVFFSPSCPSCKDVVKEIVKQDNSVALYPVDKSFKDLKQICLLNRTYENTGEINEALENCWSTNCGKEKLSTFQQLKLSFQTWCNKSYLAKLGKDSVPVIVSQSLVNRNDRNTSGGNDKEDDLSSIFGEGSSCTKSSNTCTF